MLWPNPPSPPGAGRHGRRSRTPTLGRGINHAKAREAAHDFEAFFLTRCCSRSSPISNRGSVLRRPKAESLRRSQQVDDTQGFRPQGGVGNADMVLRE